MRTPRDLPAVSIAPKPGRRLPTVLPGIGAAAALLVLLVVAVVVRP